MRISDWSSDVCSSDLLRQHGVDLLGDHVEAVGESDLLVERGVGDRQPGEGRPVSEVDGPLTDGEGIGLKESVRGQRSQRPRHEPLGREGRSEEHTSELQSLMRISYAVFCLKKKTHNK